MSLSLPTAPLRRDVDLTKYLNTEVNGFTVVDVTPMRDEHGNRLAQVLCPICAARVTMPWKELRKGGNRRSCGCLSRARRNAHRRKLAEKASQAAPVSPYHDDEQRLLAWLRQRVRS